MHGVAPGQVGGALARSVLPFHRGQQGSQAGPQAGDVVAADGPGGHGVGGAQDVVDVLGQAARIVEGPVVLGVGGAQVDLVPPRHHKDGPVVLLDREHRGDVARERLVGDGDVDALGRADGVGVAVLVQGAHLVGPHPGGVHHHRGPYLERLPVDRRHPGPTHPAVGSGGQGGHRGVVGRHRPVVEDRRAQDRQGQPGVVGPGVPVQEARHQPVGPQGGQVGQGLVPADVLVTGADAHPPGQVVEPQGGAVDPGHPTVDHPVPPEQGDEEGEGRDQVGSVLEQPLALGQVLVDQAVLVLLEVAKSAVDQLRRLGRGPRSEVVLLHQGGAEPSAGGVQGHAGPGDAPSDDQHVEGLGGQAVQGVRPLEPAGAEGIGTGSFGHGQSLPQVGPGSARPAGAGSVPIRPRAPVRQRDPGRPDPVSTTIVEEQLLVLR